MSESRQAFNERLAQVFRQETQGRLDKMRLMLSEIAIVESAQAGLSKLMPLQLEIHSLKGAARSVDRNDIELLCQDAETLLIKARENEFMLSPDMLLSLRELIEYLDRVVIRSATETVESGSNSLHVKLNALAKDPSRATAFSQGKSSY